MKNFELLAPAGNFEKITAKLMLPIRYPTAADIAVYTIK
jgi:hypothetical protein